MGDGFGGCGWGGTPCAGVSDEARPFVENFVPVPGDIVRSTPIEFDIVFVEPLVALVVSVVYRDTGATEVVYNSEGFTTNFRTTANADGILFLGSERQATAGNDHFIIRRRGGWPFSPSVLVEGADEGGKAIAE